MTLAFKSLMYCTEVYNIPLILLQQLLQCTMSNLCTNSVISIPAPCKRCTRGDAVVEAADAAVRSAVFCVLSIIAVTAREIEIKLRSQGHRRPDNRGWSLSIWWRRRRSGAPHVWSESEDCLPFLQLAQDYISSCGKKTLLEVLEKVFTSFRPLLGLPDLEDDSFEHYHADMEGEPGPDHQQMGVSQQ
ncbi:Maturin [Larimichthys crocea]|uniref:Uncharacterized protein n=1 Tax=Larimichthys crocea TaxID=215358 RepID=A0ACD3RER6_LARCR|nr:Maturin [Larimichthys crocea]